MKVFSKKIIATSLGAVCALMLLFAGVWAATRTMSFGININIDANAKCIVEMGTVPSTASPNGNGTGNYVVIFDNTGSNLVDSAVVDTDASTSGRVVINSDSTIFDNLQSGEKLYFRVTNKTALADLSANIAGAGKYYDVEGSAALNCYATSADSKLLSITSDPVNGAQNILYQSAAGISNLTKSKEFAVKMQVTKTGAVQLNLNLSLSYKANKQIATQVSGATGSNISEFIYATASTGAKDDYSTTFTADAGLIVPSDLDVSVGTTRLKNTGNNATGYTYNKETGNLFIPKALIKGNIVITGEAKPSEVGVNLEFRHNNVSATYGSPLTLSVNSSNVATTAFNAPANNDLQVTLRSTDNGLATVCPEVLAWKMGVNAKQWVSLNSELYSFDNTTGVLTVKAQALVDKILIRATAVNIWDGTTATGFAGGTGTASDPYQIATAEQLARVNSSLSSSYILTNNILLNDLTNYSTWETSGAGLNSWTPIGVFTGTFDGNGFVVSGMYINTTLSSQSLFGSIDGDATVKNLGNISGFITTTNTYASGVISVNEDGSVYGIYSTIKINSSAGYISGLIGNNYYYSQGIIENSYSNCSLYSTHSSYSAGIVAVNYTDVIIKNNFSYSNIIGVGWMGGIVGISGYTEKVRGEPLILNNTNYGTIIGISDATAGISGKSQWNTLVNNNNFGVIASLQPCASGLVDQITYDNNLINSYNFGLVVSALDDNGFDTSNGICANVSSATAVVQNCYSVGEFSNLCGGGNAAVASNCAKLDPSTHELIGTVKIGNSSALGENLQGASGDLVFEDGTDLLTLLNAWASANKEMTWKMGENGAPVPSLNNGDYYNSGNGTKSSPYIITTAKELCNINYTLDGYYKMTNDIDLNPDYKFEFNADTGLVVCYNKVGAAWNAVFVMGTGIKGETGGNTVFDTTASVAGTFYLPSTVTIATGSTFTTGVTATTTTPRTMSDIKYTTFKNDDTVICTLSSWTRIGSDERGKYSYFTGNFDGGNNTVRGMYLNENVEKQGLFGFVKGAVIQNSNTEDGMIYNHASCTAGICGYQGDKTVINNCLNKNVIYGFNTYAGGVSGGGSDTGASLYIFNSINAGTIINDGLTGGGVIGYINGPTKEEVYNCFNTGNIYSKGLSGQICGGSSSVNCAVVYSSLGYGKVISQIDSGEVFVGAVSGRAAINESCHYVTNTAYANNIAQLGKGGTTSSNSTDTGCTPYANTAWTNASQAPLSSTLPNTTASDKEAMLNALNGYVNSNPYVEVNGVKYYLKAWTRDRSGDGESDATNGNSATNRGFPYLTDGGAMTEIDESESLSGTGTALDPFLISNASELAFLGAQVNGGATYSGVYFQQTADIAVGELTPIGNKLSTKFKGNYDGNGYKITGLTQGSRTSNNAQLGGLFGYTESATIHDVTLENIRLYGSVNIGGLVGCANKTTLYNNIVRGFIDGGSNIGGLVGLSQNSVIESNANEVTISATGDCVGGIVGKAFDSSKIMSNYFGGSITGGRDSIGGIVGFSSNSTAQSNIARSMQSVGYATSAGNIVTSAMNDQNIGYTTNTALMTALNNYKDYNNKTDLKYWSFNDSVTLELNGGDRPDPLERVTMTTNGTTYKVGKYEVPARADMTNGGKGPSANASSITDLGTNFYKYYVQMGEYPQTIISSETSDKYVAQSNLNALLDTLFTGTAPTDDTLNVETELTNTLPLDLDGDGTVDTSGNITVKLIKNYTQTFDGVTPSIYWYETTVNGKTYKFANTLTKPHVTYTVSSSSTYTSRISDGSFLGNNLREWFYVEPITYIVLGDQAESIKGYASEFCFDSTNGFFNDTNTNGVYDSGTDALISSVLLVTEIILDTTAFNNTTTTFDVTNLKFYDSSGNFTLANNSNTPYTYANNTTVTIDGTTHTITNYTTYPTSQYTNNWDAAKDAGNNIIPQSKVKTFLNDTTTGSFADVSGLGALFNDSGSGKIISKSLKTKWLNTFYCSDIPSADITRYIYSGNYTANSYCENTYAEKGKSNIFLLAADNGSGVSVTEDYGIAEYFTTAPARYHTASDYARAHYVLVVNSEFNGTYVAYNLKGYFAPISTADINNNSYSWLRSGCPSYSNRSYSVIIDGIVGSLDVTSTTRGVRPSFIFTNS